MASTFITLIRGVPFDEDEDPDAAPTAGTTCVAPARPYTFRRALQNMFWMYAFGLLFIPFAISIFTYLTGIDLALGIAIVVGICLVYLGSAFVADAPLWGRLGYIGLELGIIASAAVYTGWYFGQFGVYLSVMIAALLPWRFSRWALLVWNTFVAATVIPTADMGVLTVPLIGLCVGYAMALGIESGRMRKRLNRALDRAEQRVSTLAVAAERERIGRDLHDILGHSLTAISVKSGLAAKLAGHDPAAAKTQMTEVEEIARVALTDVRNTASGLREVRLAGELASARSVLLAAGVEAHAPSALPPLSDERSQLFGYVVREAVTNLVRHAEATSATITIDESAVTVTDNGVGLRRAGQHPTRDGSGLAGIRRRVEDVGGRLTVRPGDQYGTIVAAQLETDAVPVNTATAPAADRRRAGAPQPVGGGSP